jgi:predicted 2-oxoglutarate/Fe(II)-dependent dioxygenase YbiX
MSDIAVKRFEWYSVRDSILSDDDVASIVEAARLGMRDAEVGDFTGDPTVRRSKVHWLDRSRFAHIYSKLWESVCETNDAHYGFQLERFAAPLQLARYDAADAGFYGWHMDYGPQNKGRKISVSVQLSEDTDYEGGSLELFFGQQRLAAPRRRGCVIAFPSFVMHRVTPVVRGTRYSVVGWATGSDWQ